MQTAAAADAAVVVSDNYTVQFKKSRPEGTNAVCRPLISNLTLPINSARLAALTIRA